MSNLSTLNGLFKEIYADQLQNLIPQGVTLFKNLDMGPYNKIQYIKEKVVYSFFETRLSSEPKFQRHLIDWEE